MDKSALSLFLSLCGVWISCVPLTMLLLSPRHNDKMKVDWLVCSVQFLIFNCCLLIFYISSLIRNKSA